MSIDEQDRIRGRALREKEEAQTELRCWRDKMLRMGRTASFVGTELKNLGYGHALHDDLPTHLEILPTKDDIQTALQEIQRLSDEIQRLETVLG